MMAPGIMRVFLLSFLVVSGSLQVTADVDDAEDGVTVETEEEIYQSPKADPKKVYLAENFDDVALFKKKWIKSEAKKQGVDEDIAKYDGKWEIQIPTRKIFNSDSGLVLTTEAKHAAISTLLDRPFEFKDKPLIVQYEVTMQEGQNCGGAYLKLLSRGVNTKADLKQFHDQTAYTIMFGPDKCGNDNKLHFIFRHKNPKNGTIEEKHCKKPTQRLEDIYKDKEPHLYTLIVRPDNTFSVLVDNKEFNAGSLLEDFTPPVNPPEEVDDPNDEKPEDWDEREKIVDPSASKPDDWDESEPAQIIDFNAVKPDGWLEDEPDMIPDPEAKKPADWDEEMDGEWEAPLVDNPRCASAPGCGTWAPPTIPNPKYKGIWRAPLIPNPNYKGKWSPRRIPNPDYFNDEHPFRMTPIHAVGFELWSMSPMLLFDNLIITDDPAVAEAWAAQGFALKKQRISSDSKTWWGRLLRAVKYRPGAVSLYVVYCAVPIVIYVAYLIRRSYEESVVELVLRSVGDRPWLWGAALLVSFAVLAFVAYMCCGPRVDPEADVKKTDAVVEDDPHQEEVEETSEKTSKADLEGPEPEADTSDTTPLVDSEAAGDGQRKRKPRKE
ncbi:putative Calnexin [Danaus plexippus plexippus]|uniref:Calnexin n=1 Tax=Danaus plexippus plexippus TaxID=278856 RepID=A0A212ETQ6_DANPL|nr:putative Calnexin [Danaus plexippus plexippus]